jgi:hypothetical protein
VLARLGYLLGATRIFIDVVSADRARAANPQRAAEVFQCRLFRHASGPIDQVKGGEGVPPAALSWELRAR